LYLAFLPAAKKRKKTKKTQERLIAGYAIGGGRKGDPAALLFLPAPPRISLLGSCLGIYVVVVFLCLLLVSFVFMLVSIERTPMEACLSMSRLLLSK